MARAQIACFMYHEVTDDPAASGFQRVSARSWVHSPRRFARHLEAIAAARMVPRLVLEIDPQRAGRHLMLTFDDGGRSALDAAAALERHGWKGHFFIVTSRIGERRFLDAPQIRTLRRNGHLVGSHSHTHPDIFCELEPGHMLEEWRVSCEILADITGEPCVLAAVPGGDVSAAVFESAHAAGLRGLFTSDPWLVPRRTGGCWVYGRFGVKADIPAATIRALGEFRGWRRALLLRRLKVAARRAAPPLYRLYVRHITRELRRNGTAPPVAAGPGAPSQPEPPVASGPANDEHVEVRTGARRP